MHKQIGTVDHTALLEFYQSIEDQIVWSPHRTGRFTSVQYLPGGDPWTSANWFQSQDPDVDLSMMPINPAFAGSIVEDIVKQYSLFRTRLIWLDSNSSYTFHSDRTPRVHVPIITNPSSMFELVVGSPFHIPIGAVYKLDTRQPHRALNPGQPRLHLVGLTQKY